MNVVKHLRNEVSKNAQFSRYGQARAAYLALGLGFCFATGLALVISSSSLYLFGWFAMVQVVFHLWEYTFNALFHPQKLTSSDFLLPWQHSPEFLYAFIGAIVEYFVEWYFFYGLKSSRVVFFVALAMVIAFQSLRTAAMYTAASNFTHQIAEHKTESHELVTTGVYAYLRHPSYCGWFWWAIGTQLLLANPICVVGYAVAAWRFFDDRIKYEEETLREYFGENYEKYAKSTGTGIPFIR